MAMRVTLLSLQLCLLCGFYLWAQPGRAEDIYTELNAAYGATAMRNQHTGNWHGLLGADLMSMQTLFGNRKTYALPLVSLSYIQTVYWHFGEAGVYLWKSHNQHARLALAIKARRGFNPANYPALTDMSKRDTSIDAGLHSWFSGGLLISYGLFQDISHHSNGSSASLNLSHPIRLTQACT